MFRVLKVSWRVYRKPDALRFFSESPKTAPDPILSTFQEKENLVNSPSNIGKNEPKHLTNDDLNMIVESKDVFVRVEQLQPVPETEALRKSASFEEVPGPAILKTIAKFFTVIPIISTQMTATTIQYMLSASKIFGSQLSWGRNMKLFQWLLNEYGPVVRLQGPFGGDVVIISRPEHAVAVFKNEGPYPVRSCLDCIEKYRMKHRRYKQVGPFLMFGPEWENLRNQIEEPLHNALNQYFEGIERTCDDFILRVLQIRNKQDEVPHNFINEIQKWSLECLCAITLNKRLGFLDPLGISHDTEQAKLLENLNQATEDIRRCEFGWHLWKFFETPAWRSLVKHCDAIDTILNKHILRAQESLRCKKDNYGIANVKNFALLENLLLTEGVVPEDVLTVLLDMMLIGVNATSHAISFLLYHLARNPRIQTQLQKEIASVENVTKETLEIPFLKACVKESLRLKPPMPLLTRVLSKDTLIHNFRIPKGTHVLIATHLSSLREEYFEDALKYKPERWLVSGKIDDISNFATIPFGYGPKACLARELAETQLCLFAFKILKKFRVEYHYGDINSNNKLLAKPDKPLKFRFVDI